MSGQGSRFFGRPRGRFFGVRDEMRRMDRDMALYQSTYGSVVEWYFFSPSSTIVDDIYDEGDVVGGKDYDGPRKLPVMGVETGQGSESEDDQGFATYDRINVKLSWEQARKAGFDPDPTRFRQKHLLDRFVWRGLVFGVEQIQTSGHFDASNRDMTIYITGVQMRADELLDSVVFAKYSG